MSVLVLFCCFWRRSGAAVVIGVDGIGLVAVVALWRLERLALL